MAIDRVARRPPAGRPWRYLLSGAHCDASAHRLREHGEHRSTRPALVLNSLISPLVAVLIRARFDVSLSGGLPPLGCVLVSRHDSYWDGVLIASLDPRVVPVTSRRWRSTPAVGRFLDFYGVLWTGDDTVASAISMIHRGAACWIAPRAYGRGAIDTPLHLGAARICIGARAPLLPVTLSGLRAGTRSHGPRSTAAIDIGQPIWPESGEDAAAFAQRLEAVLPRAA